MSDAVIFDRHDIEEMIKDYVRSNLKICVKINPDMQEIEINLVDGYTVIDCNVIEKDELKNFIAD